MGLTETLRSIDWQQESYPAYEDFTILLFFALFFPTVRFFLDRFIFQVLSHIYIQAHKVHLTFIYFWFALYYVRILPLFSIYWIIEYFIYQVFD
jgi:hypothetical protein